jgi:septal ring factor EnvC (AmiA/AmiB activator)
MSKKNLLVLLIVFSSLAAGCNFELASNIETENQNLQLEVTKLEKWMAEAASIEEEIDSIREQLVKKKEELEVFKKEHPEVVEYATKNNVE